MDIKENEMSGLNADGIIDEVIRLTTAVREDVTKYIQELRDEMTGREKIRYDFVDTVKNDLEAKFKHYADVIQNTLSEHDSKNDERTIDILNSNRMLAAATIYASKSVPAATRESSVADVFLLEKLVVDRNTLDSKHKS
jgi:hypothetical protein